MIATATAAPGGLRLVENEENLAISNSSDVTVTRDGKHVYGVGFSGDSIGAFNRNATTGAISFVEEQNGDGLVSPEAIIVSRDGENAYVTGNTSDTVHAYDRAANGTLAHIDSETDDLDGVDGINGAHDLVAVGNHVYVTGAAEDAVALFNREGGGGLDWEDAFINGGEGIANMVEPTGIAVSPDGRNVYVTADTSGTVVVLDRFTDTGQLDYVEAENLGDDGNDVEVAPDGKRVYVAHDDGVNTYRRSAATGALTFLGQTNSPEPFDLTSVHGLAASPGGEDVYATGASLTSGINTLKTTPNTALRFLEFDGNFELDGAEATELSPDARHVYVAGGGAGDGKIGVYSRQPELDVKGKRKQAADKIAVKAECSADCRVTVRGKGLKTARKRLKAGKPRRIRLKPKGDGPTGEKVTVKGRAKAGNRTDSDKFKVTLK